MERITANDATLLSEISVNELHSEQRIDAIKQALSAFAGQQTSPFRRWTVNTRTNVNQQKHVSGGVKQEVMVTISDMAKAACRVGLCACSDTAEGGHNSVTKVGKEVPTRSGILLQTGRQCQWEGQLLSRHLKNEAPDPYTPTNPEKTK
eukprot:4373385-Amphidinium_carterae.2